jgi:hypothetical protein
MYNNEELSVPELWAICYKNGWICYSRGGSSSKPKLMVYDSKKSAERALNSPWTKQAIDINKVEIKLIYQLT